MKASPAKRERLISNMLKNPLGNSKRERIARRLEFVRGLPRNAVFMAGSKVVAEQGGWIK